MFGAFFHAACSSYYYFIAFALLFCKITCFIRDKSSFVDNILLIIIHGERSCYHVDVLRNKSYLEQWHWQKNREAIASQLDCLRVMLLNSFCHAAVVYVEGNAIHLDSRLYILASAAIATVADKIPLGLSSSLSYLCRCYSACCCYGYCCCYYRTDFLSGSLAAHGRKVSPVPK